MLKIIDQILVGNYSTGEALHPPSKEWDRKTNSKIEAAAPSMLWLPPPRYIRCGIVLLLPHHHRSAKCEL